MLFKTNTRLVLNFSMKSNSFGIIVDNTIKNNHKFMSYQILWNNIQEIFLKNTKKNLWNFKIYLKLIINEHLLKKNYIWLRK